MVRIVLFRTNAFVVFLVVFAILYILISPLPEMAATKANQLLLFIVFALLSMGIPADLQSQPLLFEQQPKFGPRLRRSLLRTRLC